MERFALTWTGDRFRRFDPARVSLPEGSMIVPDGLSIDTIPPAELAQMTAAMRVNPTIAAFIGPNRLGHGHSDWQSRKAYYAAAEDDHETRERFPRLWGQLSHLGTAWARRRGVRGAYVFVRVHHEEMVSTLYHELFHTVRPNLWRHDWEAIEVACEPIRVLNEVDPEHPDRRNPDWLAGEEEPAAFAFERFATGEPPPFDIRLPPRVLAIFAQVKAGLFADHLCVDPASPPLLSLRTSP